MGKKRRILTRTTKFAKKYFEFLDKSDGTDDDLLAGSQIQAYVDTLKAIDNQNQTVALEGRLVGFATNDKIQWSVNAGDWKPDAGANIQVENDGAGLDRLKIDPADSVTLPNGDPLPKGSHKITVRKLGETDESLHKSTTVDVRENVILVTGLEQAFLDGVDNIIFDPAGLAIAPPSFQEAGSSAPPVLGVASTNALKVEILKDDAPLELTGGQQFLTLPIGFDYTDPANSDTDILANDLDGALAQNTVVKHTVRITPLDINDVELSDSAVEFVLDVVKK